MFENIAKFFRKLVKSEEKQTPSKETAKERLHLVLMQDRANVSADFLELMKQEIIDVIKKYIEIEESAIDVRLTNEVKEDGTQGAPSLYANIPILNIKNDIKDKSKKENNDAKPEEKKQAKEEKVKEEKKENKEKPKEDNKREEEKNKKDEEKEIKTENTEKIDAKEIKAVKETKEDRPKNNKTNIKKEDANSKATVSKSNNKGSTKSANNKKTSKPQNKNKAKAKNNSKSK